VILHPVHCIKKFIVEDMVLMRAWLSSFCTIFRFPVCRSNRVPAVCRLSWKRNVRMDGAAFAALLRSRFHCERMR
jgi:hypothetical protein